KKSDRMYGICLNKKGQAAVLNNKTTGDEIIFFPTWEKMTSFGKAHFTITDKNEAEKQRKEKARKKWNKKEQDYINRQNKKEKTKPQKKYNLILIPSTNCPHETYTPHE